MKDVRFKFCYSTLFLFVVELSILTRDQSASMTKISVLNFDQVDKFVKTYAPAPEKK